jgi:hypothetical protein
VGERSVGVASRGEEGMAKGTKARNLGFPPGGKAAYGEAEPAGVAGGVAPFLGLPVAVRQGLEESGMAHKGG